MKIKDLDPVLSSALKALPLPTGGAIMYDADSVSVRTYGPEYNHYWSQQAMDHAIDTMNSINDGVFSDKRVKATTTVLNSGKKNGTEVIVTLHKTP